MLQMIGIEKAWTWYALANREWTKRKKWRLFQHKINTTVLIWACLQNSNSDIQLPNFFLVWLNELTGLHAPLYATQYDKLSKDQKEKINVLNRPENLALDFFEDDLSPMPPLESDEKVKLELEETIAKRVQLNPRKRKKQKQV